MTYSAASRVGSTSNANDLRVHPDQPDDDHMPGWQLLMPFVICTSKGGPYDDEAFTAGYAAGRVAAILEAAPAAVDRVRFTLQRPLLPQLELIGMLYAFPVLVVEDALLDVDEVDNGAEVNDQWARVTFHRQVEAR